MESSTSSSSTNTAVPARSQPFEFYVVLDFEATCNENKNRGLTQEVIELPSVIISGKTLAVVAEFQQYVQPVLHPQLTKFCTELTGIQQAWVDDGKEFPAAFKAYRAWLLDNGLNMTGKKNFAFVTCGDWDLKTMLPIQCSVSSLDVPTEFKSWINIKKSFSSFYNQRATGMMGMLNHLKLDLEGRHHSGIDDCRNISRVLVAMMRAGAVMKENWSERN